ncbi:ABC-2 family transporter protein [compost metagenome]
MNNQMVPMMLVLASFVGSMIMGMNLQQAAAGMNPGISGGRRFAARVVLNVGASLLVSLVGTSLVFALGGQAEQGFFVFWMFQSLLVLTFLFFTQMFLLLFGMAGMLFNIAGLSLQLVSSGAMVPRQLLSGFYQAVGDYLPATYAVEGLMNVQFTGAGGAVALDMLRLAVIMGVSLAIGLTAEMVKGRKRGPAKESQVLVKPGTVVQD